MTQHLASVRVLQRRAFSLLLTVLTFSTFSSIATAHPNEAALMSASRYGGLGATVSAFYATNSHGSGFPPLGLAYHQVDATKAGRVTAYSIEINAHPPFSARERVSLLGGIDLPIDATQTNLNTNTCVVWQSRTLYKLIGLEYAAATTDAFSDSAQMRAESTPHC